MTRRSAVLALCAALLASGCDKSPPKTETAPAVPTALFEGLPLSGNIGTALAAGFGDCLEGTRGPRCSKDGVMVMGVGPLTASVDLDVKTDDGEPRFDHMTLWHKTDQGLALGLRETLTKAGWASCLTPDAERYWRPPSPLRIAIDTSYWGSRRVVISAPPPDPEPYCP